MRTGAGAKVIYWHFISFVSTPWERVTWLYNLFCSNLLHLMIPCASIYSRVGILTTKVLLPNLSLSSRMYFWYKMAVVPNYYLQRIKCNSLILIVVRWQLVKLIVVVVLRIHYVDIPFAKQTLHTSWIWSLSSNTWFAFNAIWSGTILHRVYKKNLTYHNIKTTKPWKVGLPVTTRDILEYSYITVTCVTWL